MNASACSSWPTESVGSAWPTPRAGDGDKFSAGKQRNDCLTQIARTWPTPSASDATRAGHQTPNMTGQSLVQTVNTIWPTPASRDWRAPNSLDSQERRNADSARGQQLPNFVEHCLLPPLAPPIPAGRKSSTSTRRLNPLFVEWLMQWPIGWTDCASPVTGFTPWLLRSRTALSAMLSREADKPSAQLALL